MAKVTSYKDLKVWEKSVDLVTEIYRITKKFPKEEMYGLTSQIRRASISIPSNPCGRLGKRDFEKLCEFFIDKQRLIVRS
jgi:four helix bundle protein